MGSVRSLSRQPSWSQPGPVGGSRSGTSLRIVSQGRRRASPDLSPMRTALSAKGKFVSLNPQEARTVEIIFERMFPADENGPERPKSMPSTIEPTAFDGVQSDMSIAREEIFGPVPSRRTPVHGLPPNDRDEPVPVTSSKARRRRSRLAVCCIWQNKPQRQLTQIIIRTMLEIFYRLCSLHSFWPAKARVGREFSSKVFIACGKD